MAKFYIEKLVVSGVGKTDSIIEFKEGLNFVIGPSNTGKTTIVNCIDYIFGFAERKDKPFIFDRTSGYNHISLTVRTKNGTVVFDRSLDQKNVDISGTDPNFEHDNYSLTKTAKHPLNDVWLQLMGIGNDHKILGTLKGDLHQLTLRAMLHMFFIKQSEIVRTTSVLLNPKSPYNDTASKAILVFLMSGRDADKKDSPADIKIRKAKRLAVIEYIKDSVGRLAERESKLLKLRDGSSFSFDTAVTAIRSEIDTLQAQLSASVDKSKSLMDKIYEHNSKLVECETISQRFTALRGQYHSDVERLTFIIEGSINHEGLPIKKVCPFCDGEIVKDDDTSYVDAAHAELSHIRTHLLELQKAENDVSAEHTAIRDIVVTLESEKKEVDIFIAKDLTHRINTLNAKLNDYRQAIELSKELTLIQEEEKRLSNEATNMEALKDTPNEKHDIIQYFDDEDLLAFNEKLRSVLEACQYEHYASARLNLRGTFDLEVGGKDKSMIAGGGYCGFLNTILALSLIEFLEEKGQYSPGLLIADSPLSQLSEPEHELEASSKKAGFINYLLSTQTKSDNDEFQAQIIIADHPEKLPFPLSDQQNANIIEFTRTKGDGRYGFFEGIYNKEHIE